MHGEKQTMPPPSARDGADGISGLNDDLLLHILRFMPEARQVARTSVLSRRWRDISTRAPVLHFRVGQGGGTTTKKKKTKNKKKKKKEEEEENGETLYNEFIHNVLERRANGNAHIETLDLSSWLWPGDGDSQAGVWLRHAMQIVVGSLEFHVWAPGRAVGKPKPRLELPRSTRATTMSLELYYGFLLLPPTVEFHALTELTLCTIKFIDRDDDRLGRLLSSSSCCPRLRKLNLWNLAGLEELQLNGRALEILHLEDLSVTRLAVNAPRLSELHLGFHFMVYSEEENTGLTIQAPALETFNSSLQLGYCQLDLQRHTVQLLQECRPNVRHHLYIPDPEKLSEKELEDEMTEIPQLPSLTILSIKFKSKKGHHIRAIATGIIQRCRNLRYLHLDIHRCGQSEKGYNAVGHHGSCKHDVISLRHLHEVEFSGFSGQGYSFDMVQQLLVSAPALDRMVLTMQASEEGCRRPTIDLASLMSRLPRGMGKWTARPAGNAAMLEWTTDLSMLATRAGDA